MTATPDAITHPLELVFLDASLIVINKPSGILSVPGRGIDKLDCVSSRVQQQYSDAMVVHRLDMATSGLMLMARGCQAQRALNDAFAQRNVHKRYLAEVAGLLPVHDAWQDINLPIAADWPRRPMRVIDAVHGKPSLTRWRCIDNDAQRNTSRLELVPVTGRTHQLRVHLQAIGYPILGDTLYAPDQIQALSPRLHLHAFALAFAHPIHGNMVELVTEPDF